MGAITRAAYFVPSLPFPQILDGHLAVSLSTAALWCVSDKSELRKRLTECSLLVKMLIHEAGALPALAWEMVKRSANAFTFPRPVLQSDQQLGGLLIFRLHLEWKSSKSRKRMPSS